MAYADFPPGNAPANQELSQLRADKVKQWILEKNYPNLKAVSICKGKGEQAFSGKPLPPGDPASRQVEIILSYVPVISKKDA